MVLCVRKKKIVKPSLEGRFFEFRPLGNPINRHKEPSPCAITLSWDCPAFKLDANGNLVEAGVTKDCYGKGIRYIAVSN